MMEKNEKEKECCQRKKKERQRIKRNKERMTGRKN